MSAPRTLDVSALPPAAFGYRGLMWWGTLGIVLIEGMAFALAVGAYFFLRTRTPAWPPGGVAPPDLRWGTINTVVLVLSAIPNELARRAAERIDLYAVGGGVRRRSALHHDDRLVLAEERDRGRHAAMADPPSDAAAAR